jgi:type II secretory pathway pseudopilin PulG
MSRQRGFTYLGLLFFVAVTAAGLAALGTSWSTAAQRERERELEFRGNEIAQAIASYLKTSPGLAQYPSSLDDLLADRRGPKTRHHLRRAYVDPFTGKTDWVRVPDPANPQSFNAVHSRSDRPLLRQVQADGTPIAKAQDWVFSANAATEPKTADSALIRGEAFPPNDADLILIPASGPAR